MPLVSREPLAELRSHTALAHAALEDSDLVLPATTERTRYARLIGAMLSFHTSIEREFRRFERDLAARGLPMSDRYKSELLGRESEELRSPQVAEPRVAFASVAQAAGAVYVMEGSTLGGMLIARSVQQHLDHASRYYGCYGADTGRRWRITSDALNTFARHDGDVHAMVAGANATFAVLRAHLQRSL